MNSRFSPLHGLEAAEAMFAAGGVLNRDTPMDLATRATFLRVVNSDYRTSEALALMEPESRIPLVRALLARGKVQNADRLFREGVDVDPILREAPEVDLERARMHAAAGRWNEAIIECGKVLRHPGASMLSRSAALQVRANGWIETRNHARAWVDLDQLNSFSSLLPHGQVAFYARAARVKAIARIEGAEAARHEFGRLLGKWKASIALANLDEFFTWIRIALDLARLEGKEHTDLALASIHLAKALGDESYAGLGYLDLWASVPDSQRPRIVSAMSPYLQSQPRVRSLFEEARSDSDCVLETSLRLRESASRFADSKESGISRLCELRLEKVLLLNSGIVAHLSQRKISAVHIQPRMRAVIENLAGGEISKEDLFKRVWGISRYDSNRHDALVRTALKRVREQSGLEIASTDGRVALSPSVCVLHF